MNSQVIINPFLRRQVGQCLYIVTDLDQCDEAIEESLQQARLIEFEVDKLLNAGMTTWEFLEAVESYVPSIDAYADEIADNLEEELEFTGVIY